MSFKKLIPSIAMLALSSAAIADENYSNFNLGPTVFMLKGSEESMGITSQSRGVYCGARAEIEYCRPSAFYAALVGVFAPGAGTTTHTFPSLTEKKSSSFRAYSYLWQVEGRAGKHFAFDKFSVVPYLASGIYHVGSSISYGEKDAEAESSIKMNWAYAAMGFSSSYSINKATDVAIGGKLMRHFYSKNEVLLPETSGTVELDSKWGFEVNLPVNIHAKENGSWNLQIEPFFLRIDTARDANVFGARLSVQKAY